MNELDELKNIKQALLDDLKKSITYIPNRSHDIHLMMNRYLSDKISLEEKESILANLSKCINGQNYDQPEGAVIKNYTLNDIEYLNCSLEKFFEDLQKNPNKVEELSEKLEWEIRNLQVETQMHLLDTWRMDTLDDWFNLACEIAQNSDLINVESENFSCSDMEQSL